MGIFQKVRDQLAAFLASHCPNPVAIEAALERTNLVTVHDKRPGEYLCRIGDSATACWSILDGLVEVRSGNQNVTFRGAGELVGEQALLHVLCNEDGKRAADMIACGPLQVACIDSTFQHRLRDADKISWILTLASVVNHKLEQATGDRSSLQQSADDREALLRRFADNDALGLVKLAAEGLANPIQDREVIVWFSDVANFSTWAAGKDPNEIARIIRQLTSIQIDLIRDANGIVDKLIGDGVMAFWFVDSPDRASNPGKAILCAREAITLVRQAVKKEGLDKVLDLRIGLHTGPAVFGDFGAKDRIAVTVLGATVNIAARYEQAKSPALGPLRISPELKKLADRADQLLDYFEGPIEVEVKHDVVIPIYSTKMENSNVMES